MGRDRTFKYVAQFFVPGAYHTPVEWRKEYGRPTAANLEKYVREFERATLPGGVNAHLGPTVVYRAELRRNDATREVLATYKQPLFAVYAADNQ